MGAGETGNSLNGRMNAAGADQRKAPRHIGKQIS